MDVGSLFGKLTGGGNVKVEIRVNPPPPSGQQLLLSASKDSSNNSISNSVFMAPVILDHMPSWRLHRNPFWRVKHPMGDQYVLAAGLAGPHNSPELMPDPNYSGAPNNYNYNYNNNVMGGPPAASMYGQPPPQLHIQQQQQQQQQQTPQQKDVLYAYEANHDITGCVILRLPSSGNMNAPVKKFEHLGIKVQFIGRIDMTMGIHEGRPHYDFTSLSKELAPPGMLYQAETVIPFSFKNMEKELESYRGRNVAVRYIIRVVLERKFLPPLTKEHDVWVQLIGHPPLQDEAIKMEVGIEDCLHIEFEYDRRHYHLQDTIRGKIHFLLVRIKIKHMELAVLRRETSGEGVAAAASAAEGTSGMLSTTAATVDASNIYTETQTLVKYEIMDGAPVKGEVIPVKLCLRGIPADLTPTYSAGNNRFSVRYFLNLVLVDEDDRRYFKQQEIILWRRELG